MTYVSERTCFKHERFLFYLFFFQLPFPSCLLDIRRENAPWSWHVFFNIFSLISQPCVGSQWENIGLPVDFVRTSLRLVRSFTLVLCLIGYVSWPHGWALTHISNFVILEICGTVLLHAKHCASGEVFTSFVTLEGKQITYMLVSCSLASSLENSSPWGCACV